MQRKVHWTRIQENTVTLSSGYVIWDKPFNLFGFHIYPHMVSQIKIPLYRSRMYLQCWRPWFNSWVGKIPWRNKWATHSSILAWRIPMDRGTWRATVHGVAKSQTQLSD